MLTFLSICIDNAFLCPVTVIVFKSMLSDISIATPVFFWHFLHCMEFISYIFSLLVSLHLKWASKREPSYTVGGNAN